MLSVLTQIISIPFTIISILCTIIFVIISTIFTILTFIVNILISILSLLFTVIQIVFSILLNIISFILPMILAMLNFICYSIFGNIFYALKVLLQAVFYWVSGMLLGGYQGSKQQKDSVDNASAAIGNIEDNLTAFSFASEIAKNTDINRNQESNDGGYYRLVIIIACYLIFIVVLAIVPRTLKQKKRTKNTQKITEKKAKTSISTVGYLNNPINQDAKQIRKIRQAYNNLTCSISLRLINQPGSLKCGHTFEKEQIILALGESKKCPLCLKPSTPQEVFPNFVVKSVLTDFRAQLAEKGKEWALRVLGILDFEQEVFGKRV